MSTSKFRVVSSSRFGLSDVIGHELQRIPHPVDGVVHVVYATARHIDSTRASAWDAFPEGSQADFQKQCSERRKENERKRLEAKYAVEIAAKRRGEPVTLRVHKVTATQVVTASLRFRRTGKHRGVELGGSYHPTRITDEGFAQLDAALAGSMTCDFIKRGAKAEAAAAQASLPKADR